MHSCAAADDIWAQESALVHNMLRENMGEARDAVEKAMSYLEPGSAMHKELAQLLEIGPEDQGDSKGEAELLGLGHFKRPHAFDEDEGSEAHYSTLHGESIETRMLKNKGVEETQSRVDVIRSSMETASADTPSIFEVAGRAADIALAASSRRRGPQGLGLDEEFGEVMAGNLFIDQIKLPDEDFDGSVSTETLRSNVARHENATKNETSESKQTMDFHTFESDTALEEKMANGSLLSVPSKTSTRPCATARRTKIKIVRAEDDQLESTGTVGVGEATCTAADFLSGTYDEEANAQSFQEALAAWRNA